MDANLQEAVRLRDKMIEASRIAALLADAESEVTVIQVRAGRSLVYQSLRGGDGRFVYRISDNDKTHSFVITRLLPPTTSAEEHIADAKALAFRLMNEEQFERETFAAPRTAEEILKHPRLLGSLMGFWEEHQANQFQMDRLMNSVLLTWTGSEESAIEIANWIKARQVRPPHDIRVTRFPVD